MNNCVELLLELLRAALWNSEIETSKFEQTTPNEWENVYQMAVEGTVVALCFEGVCKLPKKWQPPRQLLFKWIALAEQKQQHNRICRELLAEVDELYSSQGIEYILLKGLGVAELYHNPLLRDGGDIDLLITKGYHQANKTLIERGGCTRENNIKHQAILYKGVIVENHRHVTMLPSLNALFDKLFSTPGEGLSLAGRIVKRPQPTANTIYLTEHIAAHFFVSGIGLRHLCDLCRLFNQNEGVINKEQLLHGLRKTGTEPLLQRIGYILVHQLGLPAHNLPIEPINDIYTRKIFEDVLRRGNFGMNQMQNRGSNKWTNKTDTMLSMVKRCYCYRKVGSMVYVQQIKELLVFNVKSIFAK